MAFFKPADVAASSKRIARVNALIWIFIYAGLLLTVLGISMIRYESTAGWTVTGIGVALTALGVVLIYFRSKMEPL